MRALRSVVLILAAVAATLIVSSAAHAEPYPIGKPGSSVSTGTVPGGGSVTFSGRGFTPGERIRITVMIRGVARLLKIVIASADGSFTTDVTLTGEGQAVLAAAGVESKVVVNANIVVAESSGGGGGGNRDLALTGPSSGDMTGGVYGGAAAVLLGAGLMWVARRRRVSR